MAALSARVWLSRPQHVVTRLELPNKKYLSFNLARTVTSLALFCNNENRVALQAQRLQRGGAECFFTQKKSWTSFFNFTTSWGFSTLKVKLFFNLES